MAWASLRDAVTSEAFEKIDQQTAAFNQASNGGLILATPSNIGDFVDQIMFGANAGTARRDRTTGTGSATSTELSQRNDTAINVVGRFGPYHWGADAPQWQGMSEAQIILGLSTQVTAAILKDGINTAAAAAVAALTQANDAVHSSGAALSFAGMNTAQSTLGDASSSIACWVMNGVSKHKLIGDALGNSKELFDYQGVSVMNFDGKPFVVTDAPAFTVSTTAYNVLGLTSGGVKVDSKGAPVVAMTELVGDNIIRQMQADYSYDLSVKGFAYGGGNNPTDVELKTGTNWTKTYDSHKNGAGCLYVATQG